MFGWVRLAWERTFTTVKHALGSAAVWFFVFCYLAASAYDIVTDRLDGVLGLTLLQGLYLVFVVLTIFITAPVPPEDIHSATDTGGLAWYQFAAVLFFIILTAYTALGFHRLIPASAANIPLWTPLMQAVGNWGEANLPAPYFTSPRNSLVNPVSYLVLPLVVLVLLRANVPSLGFGPGHRSLWVILLWCGVEFVLWGIRILSGTLAPLRLVQVLISNFLQNGFFEEFLFRGALQTRLRILIDPAWALVLSALIFGLWHLGANTRALNGDWVGGVALSIRSQAVLGLVFGIIFMRTRNLLASSVVHTVLNTFFTV